MKDLLQQILDELIRVQDIYSGYSLCGCAERAFLNDDPIENKYMKFMAYIKENKPFDHSFDHRGREISIGGWYWPTNDFDSRYNWLKEHIEKNR